MADWVRYRLSTAAIQTRKQADVLRLEALSARLPSSVGAIFILRRCQMFNKLRRPFEQLHRPVILTSRFFLRSGYFRRVTLAHIISELYFPVYILIMFFSAFAMSRVSRPIVCEAPDRKYHLPPVLSLMDEPIHSEPSEMSLMLSQIWLLLSEHIYFFLRYLVGLCRCSGSNPDTLHPAVYWEQAKHALRVEAHTWNEQQHAADKGVCKGHHESCCSSSSYTPCHARSSVL